MKNFGQSFSAFCITAIIILSVLNCRSDAFKVDPNLSDLRTSKNDNDDLRRKGKRLVFKMIARHGGIENWRKLTTVEAKISWEWKSLLPMEAPANSQGQAGGQLSWSVGTDNSILKIGLGPKAGQLYGIQNWRTWQSPGPAFDTAGAKLPKYAVPTKTIKFKTSEAVKFWLPTIQYFLELQYRIREADVLLYQGEQQVGGEDYKLVLATWKRPEPQANIDQYLLYINKDFRLRFVTYTVRDKHPKAIGTMHYVSYQDVGGATLAKELAKVHSVHKLKSKGRIRVIDYVYGKDYPSTYFTPFPQKSAPK